MILVLLVAVPILFAALVAISSPARAGRVAMIGALAQAAVFAFMAFKFDWSQGRVYQFECDYQWLPSLGLRVSMGVDSISMLLLGLTALLGPICVAASKTAITERTRTYYSWLLILQGAMAGVFCARDVILFYIFFEFTLVPLYILINLYGSTNRKAAATRVPEEEPAKMPARFNNRSRFQALRIGHRAALAGFEFDAHRAHVTVIGMVPGERKHEVILQPEIPLWRRDDDVVLPYLAQRRSKIRAHLTCLDAVLDVGLDPVLHVLMHPPSPMDERHSRAPPPQFQRRDGG